MKKRTQGMNWIRKDKRLAIYMRDGMACVYCGLTLDHLKKFRQQAKEIISRRPSWSEALQAA